MKSTTTNRSHGGELPQLCLKNKEKIVLLIKESYVKIGYHPTRRLWVHEEEKLCCPLMALSANICKIAPHKLCGSLALNHLARVLNSSVADVYAVADGVDGFGNLNEEMYHLGEYIRKELQL